ncbi:MAG: hypothetical protein GY940_21090, partial [bacterium]|nr:hypothetical protein [bacterium]
MTYDGTAKIATVYPKWETKPTNTSQYLISGIPQFLVQLENTPMAQPAPGAQSVQYSDVPFNDINSYFCVPENKELIGYWDKVEDRLFKIRHCMNLQGVERQLALFSPPIDPRA